MSVLGDLIGGVGYALDTPGALMRGALEGRPGERASWGWWDLLADPVNLAGGMGLLSKLLKGRSSAQALKSALEIRSAAPHITNTPKSIPIYGGYPGPTFPPATTAGLERIAMFGNMDDAEGALRVLYGLKESPPAPGFARELSEASGAFRPVGYSGKRSTDAAFVNWLRPRLAWFSDAIEGAGLEVEPTVFHELVHVNHALDLGAGDKLGHQLGRGVTAEAARVYGFPKREIDTLSQAFREMMDTGILKHEPAEGIARAIDLPFRGRPGAAEMIKDAAVGKLPRQYGESLAARWLGEGWRERGYHVTDPEAAGGTLMEFLKGEVGAGREFDPRLWTAKHAEARRWTPSPITRITRIQPPLPKREPFPSGLLAAMMGYNVAKQGEQIGW